MSGSCCEHSCGSSSVSPRYRRVLWIALGVNVAMFGVEIIAGMAAESMALWADALDFAGDAANYAMSLVALSMAAHWRARTAMLKGVTMTGFGLLVLGKAVVALFGHDVPTAQTMGVVGFLALLSNLSVALLLYRFREGDANMRSVWLCSRNDAIGNVAVMLAAAGVYLSGTHYPDLLVAVVMAWLGLTSGLAVMRHARQELNETDRAAG